MKEDKGVTKCDTLGGNQEMQRVKVVLIVV